MTKYKIKPNEDQKDVRITLPTYVIERLESLYHADRRTLKNYVEGLIIASVGTPPPKTVPKSLSAHAPTTQPLMWQTSLSHRNWEEKLANAKVAYGDSFNEEIFLIDNPEP